MLVLVAALSCLVAATTIASAAAYTYDAPVLVRADACPNETGATASRHLADRLERSASPVIEVQGASTTPVPRSVATEAASAGPRVGSGASLDNLTPGEITRIQNAANKIDQLVSVVGSRASGTAGP